MHFYHTSSSSFLDRRPCPQCATCDARCCRPIAQPGAPRLGRHGGAVAVSAAGPAASNPAGLAAYAAQQAVWQQRPKWVTRAGRAQAYTTQQVSDAAASGEQEQDEPETASSPEQRAGQESLQVLEWPAVCKQVACFCGTSMAAEELAAGRLPFGRDVAESELLLQQTAEAHESGLEVRGLYDIRPALEAAAAGALLNAKQLEGVAATLEAAFQLKSQVVEPLGTAGSASASATSGDSGDSGSDSSAGPRSGDGAAAVAAGPSSRAPKPGAAATEGEIDRAARPLLRYPALAALASGIQDEERTLLRAIRGCIQYGDVTSSASEALAAVRTERQDNKQRLRAMSEEFARALYAKGASDSTSYSLVRNRLCVAVRAGRQGDLPKGSVRLGASSTGATLYVEPQPCIELNNAEALLAEREDTEITRVLGFLSTMLGARRAQLLSLVRSVVALDVVAGRGKHARWLGGVRPAFIRRGEGLGHSPLYAPGVRHPVLMQRGLPPLPAPPSIDDNRFDRNFQTAPAWELRRVVRPEGPAPQQQLAAGPGGDGDGQELLPRPLDLRVPADKQVVAITGPNTGGKTVTLKAAGLAALMAKAGLFLPCEPAEVAAHGPPRLLWFSQVLADIGDAQSLQQNLSTFSGHVRRIKQILANAGPDSLVLLDEVGSGTDPLEGAALARAVLDRLAGQARLTLATTHHAELKRAADQDSRYSNVSMEFDTASLRPTYRLMWGAAGASNALDIAQALGFDRMVVEEARRVARAIASQQQLLPTGAGGSPHAPLPAADGADPNHLSNVARSLMQQIEDLRAEVAAQRAQRRALQQAQFDYQEALEEAGTLDAQLRAAPLKVVKERDELAMTIQAALEAFAAGQQQQTAVEEQLKTIESSIPDEVEEWRRGAVTARAAAGSGGSSAAAGAGDGVGDDDDDLLDGTLRPGLDVELDGMGPGLGRGKIVAVKNGGRMVRVRLLGGIGPVGSTRQSAVWRKATEVRRVRSTDDVSPAASWKPAQLEALTRSIDQTLGLASEQERKAEATAAAMRRAARGSMLGGQPEAGAPHPTGLDAEEMQRLAEEVEDAAAQEYGSPELSAVVGALDGPDYAAAACNDLGLTAELPPQSPSNTIDLEGQIPELALEDLADQLAAAAPGAVLYVRHGVGTGALRDAVHQFLTNRQAAVGGGERSGKASGSTSPAAGRAARHEALPGSNGCVTVVRLS